MRHRGLSWLDSEHLNRDVIRAGPPVFAGTWNADIFAGRVPVSMIGAFSAMSVVNGAMQVSECVSFPDTLPPLRTNG